MSVQTFSSLGTGKLFSRREMLLWSAAGIVVLAAHFALAYAYYAATPEQPSAPAQEKALEIDLAPVSLSQPASVAAEQAPPSEQPDALEPVEQSQAIAPEVVEAAEPPQRLEPLASVQPDAVEPAPARAEAVTPTEAEPVEPQQRETAEATEPSEMAALPPSDISEAVAPEEISPSDSDAVALPTENAPTPTPRPEPPERTVAERKPDSAPRKEAREKATPKRKAPAQSQPAAQGGRSSAPRFNPAQWQTKVVRWLNRHKRYPNAARSRGIEGTADVSFSIDVSGRVLSARVVRSSGNSMLDQAALDMVKRSSPVPAPPSQIARGSITLGVPVNFQIR